MISLLVLTDFRYIYLGLLVIGNMVMFITITKTMALILSDTYLFRRWATRIIYERWSKHCVHQYLSIRRKWPTSRRSYRRNSETNLVAPHFPSLNIGRGSGIGLNV